MILQSIGKGNNFISITPAILLVVELVKKGSSVEEVNKIINNPFGILSYIDIIFINFKKDLIAK